MRLALLLLLTVNTCLAAPPAPKPAASLATRLEPLWTVKALRGGVAGVEVVDASTGQVLYAHGETNRLLPASNGKLFTAAAALTLLGEPFTWTTRVVSTQKPDSAGVVSGDVRIVGSGDASLVTSDFDALAVQIKTAGVTQITGPVIGDGSLFADGPYGFGWEWDDFNDEEFPQISALTVNDGDVKVDVAGGKVAGTAALVTLTPRDGNGYQSSAATSGAAVPPALSLTRDLSGGFLQVSGTVPAGQTVTNNVPVPNPPRYAAQVLADALARVNVATHTRPSGLQNGLPPTETAQTAAVNVLASHTSAPLSAYVTHMLKESDNLYAECLVRTVGVQKGAGGTFQAGLAAEMPVFHMLGVDMTGVTLVDGCGVGRRNFVTARAICGLLVGMKRSPHFATWYNALPIAGVDGTLKGRMKNTSAANNCHAKTGTLGAVRCLSGYVTGRSGRVYAFSVLLNNFPGTAKQAGAVQDALVETLAAR